MTGVMIKVWNLGRSPVTTITKGAVIHPHLVLEQTKRRIHHLGYTDEPEFPSIECTSDYPILIVGIVIGAGLIIEAMIDVPHQLLVHPHVFP